MALYLGLSGDLAFVDLRLESSDMPAIVSSIVSLPLFSPKSLV